MTTCPTCSSGFRISEDSANVQFHFPAQGKEPSSNVNEWENLPVGAINPATGCKVGYMRCSACGRMWHPISGYAA